MKGSQLSIQHRLLAALYYWLGLIWAPILLAIAQLSVEGGLWDEFGGKPMVVVFSIFFLFPPLAVLISIICQIIYWRCIRKVYFHLDCYGRAVANLDVIITASLLLLFLGAWLPVIGGYLWPFGLWLLLLIYSIGNFCGGGMAFCGKSLDLPRRIRFF
jgi:hypothetical protein